MTDTEDSSSVSEPNRPGRQVARVARAVGKGLPDDAEELLEANPAADQAIARVLEASYEYSGSIPHPTIVAGYEQLQPGSTDRILTMAEKTLDHEMRMEAKLVEESTKRAARAQLIATSIVFLVVIVGAALLFEGKSAEGFAVIVGAPAVLVAYFLFGRPQEDESGS